MKNFKTVEVPILNTKSLALCTDPLTFKLALRDPTGRLLDSAVVYIGGQGSGITDDDTIQAGGDWDIILGDSGNIPAKAVIDGVAPYIKNGPFVYAGGLGNDTIHGGGGPDRTRRG